MRKVTISLAALLIVCLATALAVAYSTGPPEETAGAPLEGTCLDCHGSYALNEGGTIDLVDAPSLYRAGHTYRIRVRLTSANTSGNAGRQWGFEMTAINTNDGTGTGTFANVPGQGTAILAGFGPFATRRYVIQTDARSGAASPVEWSVDWTAPATEGVPVRFYFVGVAGNGAQGTNGDWVYANTWAAMDTTTSTLPVSWGQIKSKYRR